MAGCRYSADPALSTVSHLHTHLSIPVIAKLRVFPALDRTLAYASHVYSSGAQLVTIHGRTREAKGQRAGFASWPKIKAVTDLLSSRVPILANGGVPSAEEVEACISETGTDGIMSAEGNLYNPMIFSPSNAAGGRAYRACLPEAMRVALDECDAQLVGEWDRDKAAYAPATFLANQYLAIVRTLPSTKTAPSAIKAHLFKLFRPVWAAERHLDTREQLGRAGGGKGVDHQARVAEYQAFVDEMVKRIQVSDVDQVYVRFFFADTGPRFIAGRPCSGPSPGQLSPTTHARRSSKRLWWRHTVLARSALPTRTVCRGESCNRGR